MEVRDPEQRCPEAGSFNCRWTGHLNVVHQTFHSLRKTYGTALASAGVPIRSIQKLLGHSDVRITAEIYADVLGTALREQVEGAFGRYGS